MIFSSLEATVSLCCTTLLWHKRAHRLFLVSAWSNSSNLCNQQIYQMYSCYSVVCNNNSDTYEGCRHWCWSILRSRQWIHNVYHSKQYKYVHCVVLNNTAWLQTLFLHDKENGYQSRCHCSSSVQTPEDGVGLSVHPTLPELTVFQQSARLASKC